MRSKEWLKNILNEKKMTQKELAEKTGLSLNAISKIVRGERYGSDDTWVKIINALSDEHQNISYECEDIIHDLNEDIEFYGKNHECTLIFKTIHGYLVFTDYIVINNEFKLNEDENYIKIKLADALKIFKSQNKIL